MRKNVAKLLLLLIPAGCIRNSRSSHFYFPENYTGWVVVYYDVKNAAPFDFNKGAYIINVPKNGVVKTSSSPEFGVAQNSYFYVDDNHPIGYSINKNSQGQIAVWPGWFSDGQIEQFDENRKKTIIHRHPPCSVFFVGTSRQREEAENHKPQLQDFKEHN